jgi:hypothetical protein
MLWKNLASCWAGYSEPATGCRISSQALYILEGLNNVVVGIAVEINCYVQGVLNKWE